MLLHEERAQGSTEYLLIAAGAIAVATAVGLYVKSIPEQVQTPIASSTEALIND